MNRPFEVTVQTNIEHSFVVEANTPEEAESIVDGYVDDGELGDEISRVSEVIEIMPVEEGAMGEVVSDEN